MVLQKLRAKARGGQYSCGLTFIVYFQVWDSLGRLLYQSAPMLSSITALAWSPTSEVFAVGAYNTLLLCHASGWLYSKVSQPLS